MLYQELPSTIGTGQPQPQMMCADCGNGPFSAERGDYFYCPDEESVLCACGADMILVREVHYYAIA
jgi:hypothetical protein